MDWKGIRNGISEPNYRGELCEGDISLEWYINGQLGVMTDGNGLY
mgnify:CR=1 FL=1